MSTYDSLPEAAAKIAARIHESSTRFVLVATGGGSLAAPALLAVPGASRTVLQVSVPYAAEALTDWLGTRPEQFCDEHTARLMGVAAYERAARYARMAAPAKPVAHAGDSSEPSAVAGVACTASLVSDRPKRGAHRVHVAAQTGEFTASASLVLVKGTRDRRQEEEIAARLLVNMVARACGVAERLPLVLVPTEEVVEECTVAPEAWRALFAGQVRVAPAAAAAAPEKCRVVFPGAFHPLHDGHREMARIAEARLGQPIAWELSITNVDKPPLDYHEMRKRAEQFAGEATLWFTRAPTFVEKASIFPRTTFVVGADTVTRIADPRYYGGDREACREAIAAIAGSGCRFLVFGRATEAGFQTLGDLPLPAELRSLCDEVPAAEFRRDLSSTELRRLSAG
ncbi:MAG: hypothetical protein HYX69_00050 [Planctomycetia bacterium]|nr:hypothetical protein [Planctomycetia bacterium]